MVPEGEKPIWESDWNSQVPLPELKKHAEKLENYGEHDQVKATRENHKRRRLN